jgi:hypothetical protein
MPTCLFINNTDVREELCGWMRGHVSLILACEMKLYLLLLRNQSLLSFLLCDSIELFFLQSIALRESSRD